MGSWYCGTQDHAHAYIQVPRALSEGFSRRPQSSPTQIRDTSAASTHPGLTLQPPHTGTLQPGNEARATAGAALTAYMDRTAHRGKFDQFAYTDGSVRNIPLPEGGWSDGQYRGSQGFASLHADAGTYAQMRGR